MQNTKLFYILKSFSQDELREFEYFIESPFHNRNKKSIRLFHELKSYFDSSTLGEFSSEIFFKELYPGKPYNAGLIRNLFSELSKKAEKFLAYSYLEENEIDLEKYTLKQLRLKKLEKLFERKIEDDIKELESRKDLNEKKFLNLYELKLLRRNYLEDKAYFGKSEPIFRGISEELTHFITFFIITMLREYFHILSYKKQLKFEQNLTLYNEVMIIAASNEKMIKGNLLIKILYNFIKLYEKEADDELYFKIKTDVTKNKDVLNSQDYDNFITEIYNYSTRRRKTDEKKFKKESMDVLKLIVKEGLLLSEGYISGHSYLNIASKGFFEGEDKWVEDFIENYKEKVIPDQRDNAYSYLLSVLNYTKGSKEKDKEKVESFHTKALDHLAHVKSEDFFYMLRIKKLNLKIFYELEDWENFDCSLDSYRHYLKTNDSIPEDLLEGNKNFVKAMKRLKILRFEYEDYLKKKYIDEVNAFKQIDFRNWLIKKAEELK